MESEDRQTKIFLDLWTWADAHKKQIFWVILLLVALGLWGGFFFWHEGQKEVSANDALAKAIVPILGGDVQVQSADMLVKVAAENPNTSAAQRALVIAGGKYFSEGKLTEARAQFDRYLRDYPGGPFAGQALFGTAVILEAQGKTSEAAAAYKDVTDRHPTDNVAPQAKFALGRLAEADGKLAQARDYYLQIEQPEFGTISSQATMRLRDIFEKHPELLPSRPAAPGTNAPILNFDRQQ